MANTVASKPWYSSLTIWAGYAVVALQAIPGVITWIDASFGQHLATNSVVMGALSIIAALVAVYGRFTAKTTIQ